MFSPHANLNIKQEDHDEKKTHLHAQMGLFQGDEPGVQTGSSPLAWESLPSWTS